MSETDNIKRLHEEEPNNELAGIYGGNVTLEVFGNAESLNKLPEKCDGCGNYDYLLYTKGNRKYCKSCYLKYFGSEPN